ncbi:MAG: substrate-binding domain-containing protein [Chloroflexota bacterium]|nr:substrate-binding domain-containing protein [Chloroflexota bacterium]
MAETRREHISLYAAGSLRTALEETAMSYRDSYDVEVEPTFGPSGVLRTRVEAGEHADVFASADMGHPVALTRAHRSGPAFVLAHTQVCALVRADTRLEFDGLLAYVLDPATRDW